MFSNTHGQSYPTLHCEHYRSTGVLGYRRSRLHLIVSVDNYAGLTWLEGALDYAVVQEKPELRAYLEAVIVEVLFEMELDTPL